MTKYILTAILNDGRRWYADPSSVWADRKYAGLFYYEDVEKRKKQLENLFDNIEWHTVVYDDIDMLLEIEKHEDYRQ
jgi:hypothetical protein